MDFQIPEIGEYIQGLQGCHKICPPFFWRPWPSIPQTGLAEVHDVLWRCLSQRQLPGADAFAIQLLLQSLKRIAATSASILCGPGARAAVLRSAAPLRCAGGCLVGEFGHPRNDSRPPDCVLVIGPRFTAVPAKGALQRSSSVLSPAAALGTDFLVHICCHLVQARMLSACQ